MLKINNTKIILIFTIVINLLALSCVEKPTKPQDYLQKNRNFLYVGNQAGDQILIYNIEAGALVDSIYGFSEYVWNIEATKSGKKLFVSTRKGPVNSEGNIYVVDLQTKEKDVIIDKSSDIYISPKGIVLLVASDPYDTLRQVGIVDTVSNEITWIDTLDILNQGYNYQSLVFDPDQSIFYALTNANTLFKYDYQIKRILRIYKSIAFPLFHMVIDNAGKFIYFAGGPVLNVEKDSVVGWVGGNYLGSLTLSPNNQFLYITDPGHYLLPEPIPTGKVKVFNTSTFSTSAFIDVKSVVPNGHSFQTDRIMITNNGRNAYVTNWVDLIFVIDLERLFVKKIISINQNAFQAVSFILVER